MPKQFTATRQVTVSNVIDIEAELHRMVSTKWMYLHRPPDGKRVLVSTIFKGRDLALLKFLELTDVVRSEGEEFDFFHFSNVTGTVSFEANNAE